MPSTSDLTAALREVQPPGSSIDVGTLGRWHRYPHLLAVALPVESSYYPVETAQDWAAHAQLHLQEELGTGLVGRASRRLLGEVIELHLPGWPVDDRFFSPVCTTTASSAARKPAGTVRCTRDGLTSERSCTDSAEACETTPRPPLHRTQRA